MYIYIYICHTHILVMNTSCHTPANAMSHTPKRLVTSTKVVWLCVYSFTSMWHGVWHVRDMTLCDMTLCDTVWHDTVWHDTVWHDTVTWHCVTWLNRCDKAHQVSRPKYRDQSRVTLGWLRLVGSLKFQVSFAKEPYKRNYILRKRPIILRSLQVLATPYLCTYTLWALSH